jgi:hypothetical protein
MKLELTDFREFTDYPSASGIECYEDKVYLIGDNAKDMLMLNKKWKKPEHITLFDAPGTTIPKSEKADLESLTLMWIDKKPFLFALGSGSAVNRNRAALINLKNNQLQFLDLTVFYDRLRKTPGIAELNIEGIATVYDYLVLVNRGNRTNPTNHLIITSLNFWKKQKDAPIQLVRVDFGESAPQGLGISGLTYSDYHEDLFLTVSTEDTPNAIDDGPIGKSYFGVIENLYRKIGREKEKMKVNKLIHLESADERFHGYKIESVCIQSEKDHSVKLQLVADNDTASSFLFKVQLSW